MGRYNLNRSLQLESFEPFNHSVIPEKGFKGVIYCEKEIFGKISPVTSLVSKLKDVFCNRMLPSSPTTIIISRSYIRHIKA